MKRPLIPFLVLTLFLGCAPEERGSSSSSFDSPIRDESVQMILSDRPSNYIGSVDRWVEALTCWREQIQRETDIRVPPIEPRGNTEDVSDLLARFPELPKSYIDFLMAGGDQFLTSTDFDWSNRMDEKFADEDRPFYPPNLVGRLPEVSPLDIEVWTTEDWLNADDPLDERYFSYGDTSRRLNRHRELFDMLVVGHVDGGWYLLNPVHRASDGEWEAAELAASTPGMRRYRTFAHLVARVYLDDMNSEYIYHFNGDWSETCFAGIIKKDW